MSTSFHQNQIRLSMLHDTTLSQVMVKSWYGDTFRIAGHLWGEPPVIPLTKNRWCFFVVSLNNCWTNIRVADDLRQLKWRHCIAKLNFIRTVLTVMTFCCIRKFAESWHVMCCPKTKTGHRIYTKLQTNSYQDHGFTYTVVKNVWSILYNKSYIYVGLRGTHAEAVVF